MALEMYGITNRDTVKKARAWLDERGIAYVCQVLLVRKWTS